MREILFKGRIKEIKSEYEELNWAFGNLVKELETGRCFISDLSHFNSNTKLADVILEVDTETVCQYTGLTDKNGGKIFEGDIVKINDDVKKAFGISDGSVVYRGGSFIIGDRSGNGTLNSLFAITDINYILRGEVIGNIYDNPELLKEDTENA